MNYIEEIVTALLLLGADDFENAKRYLKWRLQSWQRKTLHQRILSPVETAAQARLLHPGASIRQGW